MCCHDHNSGKSHLTCIENQSDIINTRVYEDLDQPPFFVAKDGLKKKAKRHVHHSLTQR